MAKTGTLALSTTGSTESAANFDITGDLTCAANGNPSTCRTVTVLARAPPRHTSPATQTGYSRWRPRNDVR